ncbi:TolC family protein [Candidatus Latescibacterota bacterium]
MKNRKNRFSVIVGSVILLVMLLISGTGHVNAQRLLTLDEAMEISMQNSPDIRRTQLDLERSRETLNARRAALKSQFRLTLNPFTYSRDKTFNNFLSAWSTSKDKQSQGTFSINQPIAQTDGTLSLINRLSWQDSYSDYNDIRNKSFNNNLYLQFTQPIYTYNRTKMETEELELDLETTILSFAIQKLSLELQVSQSFYNAYQNKLSLEIAIDDQKNREESYQIIKNKVDAGLVALEELYQAELTRATSMLSVQNAEVALENSLDNFKVLIGFPITEAITVEVDVSSEPVEVDLDKAIDNALKNRMELRQRSITLENAQNNIIRASAQNEFKGNINLSLGIIGTDEMFENLYDSPTNKQSIGISFEIPLWDWGEKKSRIKASEASYERQKLSSEDEKTSIIIGIRQTYRNLNRLANQIDIERQRVRNAELTYEINLERYRNGDLTSMELNLLQTQLSQTRMGLVRALINYKQAILDMKIQSLWDFERNEPVIPEELNELSG